MAKEKKISRKKIMIFIFTLITIFVISAFARYILTQNDDFFTRTQEFYFYSDKLTEDCPLYKIENWSGTDNYTIIINVNSNKNTILFADYAIEYDISYTCSDTVLCELSQNTGTIPLTGDSDTFSVIVKPNAQFDIGDIVEVKITASATSPYEKEVSAEFQLVVGQEKISYEIIDDVKMPYLELSITNTLSYYLVDVAFDSYLVGNRISRELYLELPSIDKEKCHSGRIKLQFDPTDVLLDMTNENYINSTSVSKTLISGYQYINGITFDIAAMTGTRIRFYKTDINQDYTYPNSSGIPIITVTQL